MPSLFGDIFRGKRVLVTGHTGFKGGWLSIWLLNLGAQVTGYSLKPPTTPHLFGACGLEKKMRSVIGDIRDLTKVLSVFNDFQPEIVFHLAAQPLVRHSYENPVETYETNIIGTVNILEACRQTPSVKSIVIITSDKCYENKGWARGYREDDHLGGYDPYSSSKGCAELVTAAYTKSFFGGVGHVGASVASARAGNVIGGGDWAEDRLLPDCVRAILAGKQIVIRYPEAIRPWQHVLEPLSGYLLLGQRLYQNGSVFGGPWNFGPKEGEAKSVRWIVESVLELWGSNVSWTVDNNAQPHETKILKLDCSKAHAKLKWHPCWDLDFSLSKSIEWYKGYARSENMFQLTSQQILAYEESMMKLEGSFALC